MSYSHSWGCWSSEMPQVRCHVHRSPASKFRSPCFSPDMPLLPSWYLSISFHTDALSCDFIYANFARECVFAAPPPHLVWGLTRLVPHFSLSVITEQSHRYRSKWQCFMKAIQHSQCGCRRRPWERSFNRPRAVLPSGRESEESHCTEITRSRQQRGVNNDVVVSEMTEVCSVSGGLTGWASKPAMY